MKGRPAPIWIAGIVLTVIGLLIAFNYRQVLMQPVFRGLYKDQIAVVEDFVGALRADDEIRIAAMLSEILVPFGKKSGVDDVGALLKGTDIRSMKILGVYPASLNGKSYCLIHIDFDNDIRKEIGFRLIKDGQRWLIDDVSLLDGDHKQ